ncbi:extracellular solute-binding protein [Paenibacillus sp. GD4]|uniref:ABC transporter substrate-binding protein n=1 Tax=Paenibacillus sp. GD4 TaxID=3068890 RepID=UPI002796CF9D|nr:extracellular solute-binding protein [Paenibacillus sp. GD4]MDQ1913450.1 extracellular solute-binding protein [Paenibacillus sp. GD4]
MKKWITSGISSMLALSLVTACGYDGAAPGSPSDQGSSAVNMDKPMTITIAVPPFADNEYETILSKAAKMKFPQVTLEKVALGPGGDYEVTVLAKGMKPDIMIVGLGSSFLIPLRDTGIAFDHSELSKANQVDLGLLEPVRMDLAQHVDGNPDVTAIPYALDTAALYYNKDIFDRFGVPYPKDNMTWDQVYELARVLTRTEDGVQYRGLEPDMIDRVSGQTGLTIVDPKTNKASVNTEGWNRLFTMMKQIYDIPGNNQLKWAAAARESFSKTKDLAMHAGLGPDGYDSAHGLNWDLVTYPVTKEAPTTSLALGGRAFSVTSLSTQKEEAFQLVKLWLSEDVQKQLSAIGRAPALNSPEARKQFGTGLPGFKGKHLDALFMLQAAKSPSVSKYEAEGAKQLRSAFQNMIKQNLDVNTALRQAEEQINKAVEQLAK